MATTDGPNREPAAPATLENAVQVAALAIQREADAHLRRGAVWVPGTDWLAETIRRALMDAGDARGEAREHNWWCRMISHAHPGDCTCFVGATDADLVEAIRNGVHERQECANEIAFRLRLAHPAPSQEPSERERELEAALRAHHEWHLQSGAKLLFEENGGERIVLDNAAEYADSSLYERTEKALIHTPEPSGAVMGLREVVQRFVDDFGRNGSKTGRADYLRHVPLDRIDELRRTLSPSPLKSE